MGVISGIKNNIIKPKVEPIKKTSAPTPKPVSTTNTNNTNQTAGTAFKQAELNFTGQQTKIALNNQLNATQQAKSGNVDQDNVDFYRKRVGDANQLAIILDPNSGFDFHDTPLNEAEKSRLVGDIFRSDDAQFQLFGHPITDIRNETYDDQTVVADALNDAYRNGEISDADINNYLERVGPEGANELVLALNADPNNALPNNIIEAVGEQSEALGYDQAAALAYTSSASLIREHLPTDASQRAAFEQVENYVDNHPLRDHTDRASAGSGALRADLTFAVANIARLTAQGNGYTDGEFDNLLEDLGPGFTNEVVARTSSVIGDRGPGGAVELLGRSSARIAENAEGDDKTKWEVNQYTAFTQTSTLISRNLPNASDRMEAFDVLNRELARSRDDVDDAVERDFKLLSQPIEANGLSRLLQTHGAEIFDAKIGDGTNYEGQADIVQALQSTLYSPTTDRATANRIANAIGDYIGDQFDAGSNGQSIHAERIGTLIGLHDVAFQRGLERASTPEGRSRLEQLQVDVAKTVISKTASTLLASTGPIGATAGGFVVNQLLTELFKDRSPSATQLGQEFLNLLDEKGIDIQQATGYRDSLVRSINVITDGLQPQLDRLLEIDDPTVEEQRQIDDIQTTLLRLNDLKASFRTRALETVETEYENPNGSLREALNDW